MKIIPLSAPKNGEKPHLDYPCLWQYKVIGTSREALLTAIAQAVGEEAHIVTDSHSSRHGRYKSLNLEIVVKNESQRLTIQQTLAKNPAVRVVI